MRWIHACCRRALRPGGPVSRFSGEHRRAAFAVCWLATWPVVLSAFLVLALAAAVFSQSGWPFCLFIWAWASLVLSRWPAAWLFRRLGLSLESRDVQILQLPNAGAAAPVPASRRWRRVLCVVAAVMGVLAVVGWGRGIPHQSFDTLSLASLVSFALSLLLLCIAGADFSLWAGANSRGIWRIALAGYRLTPWEQIGGCRVERQRDPLGRAEETLVRFHDSAGVELFAVSLGASVHPARHAGFLAAVRGHHGIRPDEPAELEASPPPEGTGMELEAAPAPAGRGTELEASRDPRGQQTV